MVICRKCDRGNVYCGPECSERARVQRRREAARRYQATARGRAKHRERQRRFRRRQRERQRRRESVTHQGSELVVPESTVQAAPKLERSTDETQRSTPQSLPAEAGSKTEANTTTQGRPQEGQRPCCICGRWCGPYVRTERLALCAPRATERERRGRPPRAPPRR